MKEGAPVVRGKVHGTEESAPDDAVVQSERILAALLSDNHESNSFGIELFYASHEKTHPLRSIVEEPDKFFNTMYATVNSLLEKNSDQSDREADALARNLREQVFSGSPNLFNHLSLSDMLIWSANMHASAPLRRYVEQAVIGELVYELSFVSSPKHVAQVLVENLKKQDIARVLNLIDQISHVRALAEYESYAEGAYAITTSIIDAVHEEFSQAVVRHACVEAIETPVRRRVLRKHQEADLATHTHPDRALQFTEMFPVGPNTIGYTDEVGELQYVAVIPQTTPEHSQEMNIEVHPEPLGVRIKRELPRESTADRITSATRLLQYIHRPEWGNWVVSVLGRGLSELPLGEQVHFADSLIEADEKQLQRLSALTHSSYGREGMRAFLATAYDPKAGEYILSIAETYEHDDAASIFKKFAEFADATAQIETDLGDIAENTSASGIRIAVQQHLMNKAVAFLRNLGTSEKTPEEKKVLLEKMLKELTVSGQMLVGLFRAQYKDAREQGKPPPTLESIVGVEYRTAPGEHFVEQASLYEQACEVYKRHNPKEETAALLVLRFGQGLREDGATVHHVTFKEKLVTFMLVKEIDEHTVHVSALNVDREVMGAQPGRFLIQKILEMVQAGKTVRAEAEEKRAKQYIEQYGFEEVGRRVDEDGVELIELELRPQQ